MIHYKTKYLKYKTKYLELKNMIGGNNIGIIPFPVSKKSFIKDYRTRTHNEVSNLSAEINVRNNDLQPNDMVIIFTDINWRGDYNFRQCIKTMKPSYSSNLNISLCGFEKLNKLFEYYNTKKGYVIRYNIIEKENGVSAGVLSIHRLDLVDLSIIDLEASDLGILGELGFICNCLQRNNCNNNEIKSNLCNAAYKLNLNGCVVFVSKDPKYFEYEAICSFTSGKSRHYCSSQVQLFNADKFQIKMELKDHELKKVTNLVYDPIKYIFASKPPQEV